MLTSDPAHQLNAFANALEALAQASRGLAAVFAKAAVQPQKPEAPSAENKRVLPTLDDLRRVKAKNVSWQQLLRGGLADLGSPVEGLRRSDKSLARRLTRENGLTIKELVQILEEGGITIE